MAGSRTKDCSCETTDALAQKHGGGLEIKTARELEKMRNAGRMVAQILEILRAAVKPGITTLELDRMAAREAERRCARAAFLNYCDYPAVICASVNDEVVHGIPDKRSLSEGDIVSIDMGILHDGYYSDAAITVPVGRVDVKAEKLMEVTKEALNKAINTMRPGVAVGDISSAIEKHVLSHGMSVVRKFVGHGIGRRLHEEPAVPNYGNSGTGLKLVPGIVLAIEPMVCLGDSDVRIKNNKWTAVTCDGSWSAHFEHTVAVTENGSEILTMG